MGSARTSHPRTPARSRGERYRAGVLLASLTLGLLTPLALPQPARAQCPGGRCPVPSSRSFPYQIPPISRSLFPPGFAPSTGSAGPGGRFPSPTQTEQFFRQQASPLLRGQETRPLSQQLQQQLLQNPLLLALALTPLIASFLAQTLFQYGAPKADITRLRHRPLIPREVFTGREVSPGARRGEPPSPIPGDFRPPAQIGTVEEHAPPPARVGPQRVGPRR